MTYNVHFYHACQGVTSVCANTTEIGKIRNDPKTGRKTLHISGPNGERWHDVTRIFNWDHKAMADIVREIAAETGAV